MDDDIRHSLSAGDLRRAFERVLETYQEKVFRLACGLLRDETCAEDMTQEVFLKIWKALPGFKGEASLSSWIYTITRNTCFSELKRRRPTVSLSEPGGDDAVEHLPEFQTPEAHAGAQLDISALLRRLPEYQRQIISLFYLEQKSYEDVAAMLDLPLGTVKTHLHRARRTLAALALNPAPTTP
jgi:RNA polymerase sigma-70 factor (ECF subfamily)